MLHTRTRYTNVTTKDVSARVSIFSSFTLYAIQNTIDCQHALNKHTLVSDAYEVGKGNVVPLLCVKHKLHLGTLLHDTLKHTQPHTNRYTRAPFTAQHEAFIGLAFLLPAPIAARILVILTCLAGTMAGLVL